MFEFLKMYRRRGLSDEEILLELEGDVSGEDFSDSDDDEYDLVASAVRAQVEEFISRADDQLEDILREIAGAGNNFKFSFRFEKF